MKSESTSADLTVTDGFARTRARKLHEQLADT